MSGTLPNWLVDWLGIELAESGDIATWQLDFTWNLPPWATVLLVLIAVASVLAIYRRELSLAGSGYRALLASLRLAAFGLVLLMLTQATLTFQRIGPPSIALMIDHSASMGLAEGDENLQAGSTTSTRMKSARQLLEENNAQLLSHLVDKYRLQTYAVASTTMQLPPTDLTLALGELTTDSLDSDATRLGDAIQRVLSDFPTAPLAAIVLLTDGVVTDGLPLADAAQAARARGVPLFAVGIGSDRAPRDVQIADVLVDEAVFVDDLVAFDVQVRATGLAGQVVHVVLRRDDDTTLLAEQTITLGPDGESQAVFLTHRPTAAGEINYVIEVASQADESNRDNNRELRTVTVRDEKIRVLLAFGYPSYEFRFLKTLLERDPTIELSAYLQDADPEYAEQDRTALRAFPLARDELFKYDVLMQGDVNPRLLPRSIWPELREFVTEKGGGVVFIAGPRFMPWDYVDLPDLALLLPFDLSSLNLGGSLPEDAVRGFVVRPTPLGLQLPPFQLGDTRAESEQIWQRPTPLHWLVQLDSLKPAAQVLADHPTGRTAGGRALPVIVGQYVGAGKVWFHAIDSTWRWRIGVGDVYFARYWVQTIRYLARGKLMSGLGAELTTDRREYQRGEAVDVRLRYRDERLAPAGEEVTLLLESPGEAHRQLALRRNARVWGLFEGSLTNLGAGDYVLLLATPQASGVAPRVRFSVAAPNGELAHTAMDRAALTAAAEATRGKFYTLADTERLIQELPRGRRVLIESLAPLELWNLWWVLAAFLLLLIGEWILRKRLGML